jgi:hypothetical protein
MGTPTFEEQVKTVVDSMAQAEDGSYTLPEGLEAPEEVLYAAKLEKRYRDTQSSYTKAQQRAKQLEIENQELTKSWEQDAAKTLSVRERARLDELKISDPDTWREEITKLESSKKQEFTTKRQEISTKTARELEVARRQELVEAYNKSHPDTPLTDEVIENDIPPRLTKQLEKGDITFDEYLAKCDKYLNAPRKLEEGEEAPNTPGFATARGSNRPSKEAIAAQSSSDYTKEIF